MRKNLSAILMTFGTLTLAHAASTTYDTDGQTKTGGTLTNKELIQEHLKYLKNHPKAFNDSQLWLASESYVPSHIRFVKSQPTGTTTSQTSKILPPANLEVLLPLPASPLDQGEFGTCATFASIAGIINSRSITDYEDQPSPSCLLNYMVTSSGGSSNPWEGATTPQLFNALEYGGVIENSRGDMGYCNISYPTYQPYGNMAQDGQGLTSVSATQYRAISQVYHAIQQVQNPGQNGSDQLNFIKQEITAGPGFGNYVLFSFNEASTFVTTYDHTGGGNVKYAAWVDTGARSSGYHAILAYGYDDYYCIDTPGTPWPQQCGVLFLRNSWGANSSTTNGNYLMTYQYFYDHFDNTNPMMLFNYIPVL